MTDAYPHGLPGHKEHGGTSEEAAERIAETVGTLRWLVLDALRQHGPMTADEVAAAIRRRKSAVRPRLTELSKMELVQKTGLRRKNETGMSAVVWRVA